MPHLWIEEEGGGGRFRPLRLDARCYALDRRPPTPWPGDGDDAGGRVRLVSARDEEGLAWVVIAAAADAVQIDGRALTLGLGVLGDRQSIRVEGIGTAFFSAEDLPRVETFPGADRAHRCPRCWVVIAPGDAAVRCPRCRVWHHQREDRRCWTYHTTCATCPQPTALDAPFAWTPEGA